MTQPMHIFGPSIGGYSLQTYLSGFSQRKVNKMLFGFPYEVIMIAGLILMVISLLLAWATGWWPLLLVSIVAGIIFATGHDCLGIMPNRACYPELVPAMMPLSPEKKDALVNGIIWLVLGFIALPLLHTFRKSEVRRIHGRERLDEIKRKAEKNGEYPTIRWAINEKDPSQGFEVWTRNKNGRWNWVFQDKDGNIK